MLRALLFFNVGNSFVDIIVLYKRKIGLFTKKNL